MKGKRGTYQAQHYTEMSSELNDWQIYPKGIRVPCIHWVRGCADPTFSLNAVGNVEASVPTTNWVTTTL